MINVEAQTLPLNFGQAKAWGVVMTMIKGLVVFIILPPASFPFRIKKKKILLALFHHTSFVLSHYFVSFFYFTSFDLIKKNQKKSY